jgi:hypothetical protein
MVLSRTARRRRGAASAAVLAMWAGGLTGLDLGVVAPAVAQAASVEDVSVRPDLTSAMVSARASGHPVEVASMDSEFVTAFANPDGTITVDTHSGQQRYRDKAGRWQRVDLKLTSTDAGVSPRGHAWGGTVRFFV